MAYITVSNIIWHYHENAKFLLYTRIAEFTKLIIKHNKRNKYHDYHYTSCPNLKNLLQRILRLWGKIIVAKELQYRECYIYL